MQKVSLRLQDDDQTPRAYLDAVREAIEQRISEVRKIQGDTSTKIGQRLAGAEIGGLRMAQHIVEEFVNGLDWREEGESMRNEGG